MSFALSRTIAVFAVVGALAAPAAYLPARAETAPQTPAAANKANKDDASSFRLDNGLEVVVIPDHRAPVVTHMLWYHVGSADEEPGKSGIAHFFEHLMFKATKTYPAGEFSRKVAEIGGQENAFTSYDYTAFYQQVAPQALEMVMTYEADRMENLILNDHVVIKDEVFHAVRLIGHDHFERLRRDLLIKRGVVIRGESIFLATDLGDLAGKLPRWIGLGGLEHQVLKEMGNAGFSRFLVSGTNVVPQHMRDYRRAMIRDHHDFEAIVQSE